MSLRFLPKQIPVALAMGLHLAKHRLAGFKTPPQAPGKWLTQHVAAPSNAWIDAYISQTGSNPALYRHSVPPHLHCQWSLPMALRAMAPLPYSFLRMVNAGCRLEIRSPLPRNTPLIIKGRLVHIDDDGRRAIVSCEVRLGVRHTKVKYAGADPAANIVAHMQLFVSLPNREKSRPKKSASPSAARASSAAPTLLERWRLQPQDSHHFAALTGDPNPIHWLRPYARRMGYRGVILHGFASAARAYEGLLRSRPLPKPSIRCFETRFTAPLELPADVGLYSHADGSFFVATGALEQPFMAGHAELF